MPTPPVWLHDEPTIKQWLHKALTRLEHKTGGRSPQFVRFSAAEVLLSDGAGHGREADMRWDLITSLVEPLGLSINKKSNAFGHDYDGATLTLPSSCEDTLRAWLDRPQITPELHAWRSAVNAASAAWSAEARTRLRERVVAIPGQTADSVVDAFARLGELRGMDLTLRQMSARAFFGDSKFLEGREALVQALYPDLAPVVRPLLVDVFLPEAPTGVLFIENQDSYASAVRGRVPQAAGLALVYAAGFKASAGRIRGRDGAILHFSGPASGAAAFEHWWFGERACPWPVYVWGDLDFEGMAIVKALRAMFAAEAWQPGYAPLLAQLGAGRGHDPAAARKQEQSDPGSTGCAYADGVLLPALREHHRFVDQECAF